jgi:hypothetical protein
VKALSIKYERVVNLGNYESERIAIELAIEKGDTAEAALSAAKRFVSKHIPYYALREGEAFDDDDQDEAIVLF